MDVIGKINKLVFKKQSIEDRIKELNSKKEKIEIDIENVKKAQAIIITVAKSIQSKLEYNISGLVTLALQGIFEDAYSFVLSFVEKRGKTEAEIYLERDDMSLDPLMASGGGVVDVVSFALRVSLWSLQRAKLRRTIVLDEPFKHLSVELQILAVQMLKELSNKLGLQFIMVTHASEIISGADKVFYVSLEDGISMVEEK